MDYSKLSIQERIDALRFHNLSTTPQLPNNWQQLLQSIKVEPGAAISIELIDLYIADQLYKQGIQIPAELNMETITSEYYRQLAPVLYIPIDFTPENYSRAKRIIRIIRDLNTTQQQVTVPTPLQITQTKTKIEVIPLVFYGPNQIGDFNWMIKRPEYNDILFLFNDNESQFAQFINSLGKPTKPPGACSVGGGNAIIRPYQCLNPPRAAGIPTGDNAGGYNTLTRSKQFIDNAFVYIQQLLQTGRYKRIAYSASEDGTLGTHIFSPSQEVKQYILGKILSLAN